MKKLLTLLLGIALIAPLYSQEAGEGDDTGYVNADAGVSSGADEQEAGEKPAKEKKEAVYERQVFEFGLIGGIGFGFDNAIIGTSEIFKKKIEIDLSKLADSIPEDGAGINFGITLDILSFDIKNIHIGKGLWSFGLTTNIDGDISLNIPKSLFTLIAEGNTGGNHSNSGTISGSGGIFSEVGIPATAKYQVAGRTLTIGAKLALYTPVVYIPSSTGISYNLYTEKNGSSGLFLDTQGDIDVYTATSFEKVNAVEFIFGRNGFDISLEGEYDLFPFLDIGVGFFQIPFVPATLTSGMTMGIEPFSVDIDGEAMLGGGGSIPSAPEFKFKDAGYFTNRSMQISRPFRFDVYALFKPLALLARDNPLAELIVIRPNIGFSVNATKGDEEGFFNAGLEARLNLQDLFIFYIGSGYQEGLWRQKAGLALNLRVFEFDFEAALRNQTFAGCFQGRGFSLFLGTRWGW